MIAENRRSICRRTATERLRNDARFCGVEGATVWKLLETIREHSRLAVARACSETKARISEGAASPAWRVTEGDVRNP